MARQVVVDALGEMAALSGIGPDDAQLIFAEAFRPAVETKSKSADDLMETVSGSFGTTGGADTILVMASKASGAVLDIRGRDVESAELAIEFSKESCKWRILGDSAEIHVSAQRAKIIAALKEADQPMRITELVEATAMKRNPLEALLGKMVNKQEIKRIKTGVYAHKDYVPPSPDKPIRAKPSDRSDRSDFAKEATNQIKISQQPTENTEDKETILPSDRSDRESTNGKRPSDLADIRASVKNRSDRSDDQIGGEAIEKVMISGTRDLNGRRSDRSDQSDAAEPEPGQIFARVSIREVRHPAIKSGPDDSLDDLRVF